MSSIEAPIVLTSSSPLPAFARSPTPVDVTKQYNSSQYEDDGIPPSSQMRPATFHNASRLRPGFTSSFTSARSVLGARSSAENVPLQQSSPTKFVPPKRLQTAFATTQGSCKTVPSGSMERQLSGQTQAECAKSTAELETIIKVLPGDARKRKKDTGLQAMLAEALARKQKSDGGAINSGTSFDIDPAAAFGDEKACVWQRAANVQGDLVKRQKVANASPVPVLKVPDKDTVTTKKGRTKSPVKKGLTITALVTSKFDEAPFEPSPMAQYLVSTQARSEDNEMNAERSSVQVKFRQKKSSAKKRSKVISPRTAQKRYDSQEFIFASASQLAREESPTTLKETLEAIRRSEEGHDFVQSQQSAALAISQQSPARAAVLTRYQGRKGLWAASGRDEDGALMHADELYDMSTVALSGMDEEIDRHVTFATIDGPSDSISLLSKLNHEAAATFIEVEDEQPSLPELRTEKAVTRAPGPIHDIDALSSPTTAYQQVRNFSTSQSQQARLSRHETSAKSRSPSRSRSPRLETLSKQQKVPAKPNYNLWTDERLKEEVVSLGHKRLRARQSMINKLDDHYAEQHGLDPKKVKAATKKAGSKAAILQQVDMLGKAHDFAQRPAPPKQRKPRKKKNESRMISRNGADVADIREVDNAGMSAFDRLNQMEVLSSEDDVEDGPQDDIEDLTDVELPPSTAPNKGTGVMAMKVTKKAKRDLTPPPLKSPKATQFSSPGFELARPKAKKGGNQTSRTPGHDASIETRIQEAILADSEESGRRNQQVDPTWYQKMLMYDPIVLESLTVWLNTRGFNNINEDREIDAETVKAWCDQNGICRLWDGGWRSNKKKAKSKE